MVDRQLPGSRKPACLLGLIMSQTLALVLEASRIPDGAKVTKLGGTDVYVLRHQLEVYPKLDGSPMTRPITLSVPHICYLVVDAVGYIEAVQDSQRLVWNAPLFEVHRLLSRLENDDTTVYHSPPDEI